jgi:shikimate dehydrogenase
MITSERWMPFNKEPEDKKGLGLIGYPLSHSFSKQFFTEKFEKENIQDFYYDLFPIPDISMLPELFDMYPNLLGVNVTIPYKKAVIPFLDDLHEEAAAVGAVNVIKRTPMGLVGYNSDVYGFGESLNAFLQHKDASMIYNALILGNGGAAKAVLYQLPKMGILPTLVSRTPTPDGITYDDLTPDIMNLNRLIIQTTPLGMSPHLDASPLIPYSLLTPRHFLYDLIYNPEETLFLKQGKARGAKTCNGYEMLVLQALKSWDIWTADLSNGK